ncbi:MAG: alginate export family protein [Planctomycetes bacterium]|nr:alginate export family protein [Planctomycetota bacterium]
MTRSAWVLVLVLWAAGTASAQTAAERRAAELERQRELRETEILRSLERGFHSDYGAWVRSTATAFDTGVPTTGRRTLRDHDLRLWTGLHLRETHTLYVRGRATYVDYNPGDNFRADEDDVIGPNLDLAWYRLEAAGLLGERLGADRTLDLTVGRQYLDLGSGLVLNDVFDGAELRHNRGNVELRGIGARSVLGHDDLDFSRPNGDTTKRFFYGGELRLRNFLSSQEPYLFAVLQRDSNQERPDVPAQAFRYDSNYYGAGATGELVARRLRYSAEYVFENGNSMANGASRVPDDIQAHALNGGAEWFVPGPEHVRFHGQYIWASGDPERASPTNTIGGNRRGTDDTGFNAFGWVQTGVAFQPLVSNLEVVAAGVSARPLGRVRALRRLELGGVAYSYRKDEVGAGISDSLATRKERNVGQEVDAYLAWRMASDLAVGGQWGIFFPGDAFPDSEDRQYATAHLTLSF